MTPTKEMLEYCANICGPCFECPGFEGADPANESCTEGFARELLDKCTEVEELRKALEPFAEPGHWNVNRNFWVCPDDPIRLARKALEGKE